MQDQLKIDRRVFCHSVFKAFITFGLSSSVIACSDESVKTLRIGLLPDQDEKELIRRFKPLFDHVSGHSGVNYEFVIPESYASLVKMFEDSEIDMAYFGGFTFVKVEAAVQAKPLVMRGIDRQFKSVFLASNNSTATSINDLKGRKFSFGSRLSTSGHLMPRFFLNEQGINPEEFFSEVIFSGSHDKTALAVQNGSVEAGVLNGEIAARMFANGDLKENLVRIIWETPPYADYVWAIQDNIEADVYNRIRDAFLSLSNETPKHQPILEAVGAKTFLPAHASNFTSVRRIATSLGML